MDLVPEFYVLCDSQEPPVRLSRSNSSPRDLLHFSAPLPSPLPSQLLFFCFGDWSGIPADGKVQVKLEGGGANGLRLGTLTNESRCFLWDRGPSYDSTWMLNEAELRITMAVQGKVGVKSSGMKQERGKRRRMAEEVENICPNRGNPKERSTQQKSNSSRGGAPTKPVAQTKGIVATADAPTARWGQALCPVDFQTVILIGGQGTRMQFCKDSMWKLNTEMDSWSPAEALTDGPSPETRTGHTATFDPDSHRIYVFGGSKNRKWFNDVHILDTKAWRWRSVEARGKVPPLAYHSCSLFRGELFVFGGVFPRPNPEPDGCSNSLYIFDPQHEIWYQPIVLGEIPPARSGHSSCLLNRKLYIFGGWDTPVCYSDLYLLDLGIMEFSPVEVMGCSPSPRCWHSSAPVSKYKFLIHGGYDGNQALSDTYMFNTVTQTWTSLVHASLPRSPRAGHSMLPLTGAKEEEFDEGYPQCLLIFGGGDNEGQFYSDTVRIKLTDEPAKPLPPNHTHERLVSEWKSLNKKLSVSKKFAKLYSFSEAELAHESAMLIGAEKQRGMVCEGLGNLQQIINDAVAASIEKAFAGSLSQLPNHPQPNPPPPTAEDSEDYDASEFQTSQTHSLCRVDSSPHLPQFLHSWLRQPLDKEVRAHLRSECPRPVILDKLALTPEFDPTMCTFMAKSGRDPRMSLEKGLKSAQDKLLDVTGPMAQILYLANSALSSDSILDVHTICKWIQRCIYMVGNANIAISNERRKAALLRIDPKLAELSIKELGPSASGMLFGEPFLKELQKHVNIFSSLSKAQVSLKKVFHPPQRGVFGQAGRQWGRVTSRFWPSGPRNYPSQSFYQPSSTRMLLPPQRGSAGVFGDIEPADAHNSTQASPFSTELDFDFLGRLDSSDCTRLQDRISYDPSTILTTASYLGVSLSSMTPSQRAHCSQRQKSNSKGTGFRCLLQQLFFL
ncbi:uncharacterized protein WCC33_009289 [Rhinophrynus dorsalis]